MEKETEQKREKIPPDTKALVESHLALGIGLKVGLT